MVFVFLFQHIHKFVYGIFEGLIILPDLAGIYHVKKRGEVLFTPWHLIVDIAYKGGQEKSFSTCPEGIASVRPFRSSVFNDHVDKL